MTTNKEPNYAVLWPVKTYGNGHARSYSCLNFPTLVEANAYLKELTTVGVSGAFIHGESLPLPTAIEQEDHILLLSTLAIPAVLYTPRDVIILKKALYKRLKTP